MSDRTSVVIEGRQQLSGGTKLTMRLFSSTRQPLATNELPNILNSVRQSGILEDITSRVGFDYLFSDHGHSPEVGGFKMRTRPGFPYFFDDQGPSPEIGGFKLRTKPGTKDD